MYTRCPECATVFRVTADQLRMAHGDVRCGNCSKSFNALMSLMDEAPDPAEIAPESGDAVASQDGAPDSDADMEFDVPEQSWSNFFVPSNPAPALSKERAASTFAVDAEFEPLDEQTGEHEEWRGLLSEIDVDPSAQDADAEPDDDASDDTGDDEPTNEHPIIVSAEAAQDDDGHEWVLERVSDDSTPATIAAPSITEFDYADYVENVVLESDDDAAPADSDLGLPPWISEERLADAFDEPAEPASRAWYWTALLLLVVLVGQLVHTNRDTLATHPRAGGAVRATYGWFGVPLYPQWSLDDYEVTGSDAVAGRTAAEALDILAEVAVRSDEAAGLPLVRVLLRDRWSNPVANGVFTAEQYLRGEKRFDATAAPGATIPIEISVLDPGSDALGYVVDVCLPRRDRGLVCQLDQDPFQE